MFIVLLLACKKGFQWLQQRVKGRFLEGSGLDRLLSVRLQRWDRKHYGITPKSADMMGYYCCCASVGTTAAQRRQPDRHHQLAASASASTFRLAVLSHLPFVLVCRHSHSDSAQVYGSIYMRELFKEVQNPSRLFCFLFASGLHGSLHHWVMSNLNPSGHRGVPCMPTAHDHELDAPS